MRANEGENGAAIAFVGGGVAAFIATIALRLRAGRADEFDEERAPGTR